MSSLNRTHGLAHPRRSLTTPLSLVGPWLTALDCVVDGAGLMGAARHEGWTLHFADLDIDTSTLAGELAANIIISGSQYERRLISQRTRDALAAKRARGERLGAAPA